MGRVAPQRQPGQRAGMDALPLVLDWLTPHLGRTPLIIGLAGAQGSGKSTLAAQLAQALPAAARTLPSAARPLPPAGRPLANGWRGAGTLWPLVGAAVSLDDFYLPRARRLALARQIHPLFATRGPPGTHDLPLLVDVLLRVRAGRPVNLPVFSKSADDRLPPQHWRRFDRIDILILEGWCIGARPQPAAALAAPINRLEAREDPAARWRTRANQALAGSYQRAWATLDALLFLAAPDWETVPTWRAQQERTNAGPMDSAALNRFCAHYERLTRWQLLDTPRNASLVLRLDGARRVVGMK
jgi:D-glycerate 3-kinase